MGKRKTKLSEGHICIGEEIGRWTVVKNSLSLSDDKLMKAVLDLLEDRRVCPHGCYMKNTSTPPKEVQKIRTKTVRTVGTQTKTKKRTLAAQTDVTLLDSETVRGPYNKTINSEGHTKDGQFKQQNEHWVLIDQSTTAEDRTWQAMKTSLGIKTDEAMLKTLLDWYASSPPTMQLNKGGTTQSPSEQPQPNKEPSQVPNNSYFLTLSVTPDQEQAIRNLCLLREWPYTKYRPMSPTANETEPDTRKYKPPVATFDDSTVSQRSILKPSESSLVTEALRSAGELVTRSDPVSLEQGRSDLVTRSVKPAVTSVSMPGETTVATLETSLLTSVAATESTQGSQNVYIPVQHGRESETVYKQMNIQQSEHDLRRREDDSVFKTMNSQIIQQRAPQMSYVLPNTVPLENMGIFPKTTTSLIQSSGPFTSTNLEYEHYRRKIDDRDSASDQKYKKIRLTPQSTTVSIPTGSGQEPFQIPSTEEQFSQIPNSASVGYGYMQTGYSQQGH